MVAWCDIAYTNGDCKKIEKMECVLSKYCDVGIVPWYSNAYEPVVLVANLVPALEESCGECEDCGECPSVARCGVD